MSALRELIVNEDPDYFKGTSARSLTCEFHTDCNIIAKAPTTALLTEVEFFTCTAPLLHYVDNPKETDKEDFKDTPPPNSSSKTNSTTCTKSRYARKPPDTKAYEWRGFKEQVLDESQ